MLRFHDSLAPNLRIAGVHLKAARELLRHANSLNTLEVYASHLFHEAGSERPSEADVFGRGKERISTPSSALETDGRRRTIRSLLKLVGEFDVRVQLLIISEGPVFRSACRDSTFINDVDHGFMA
jgi:hypothetical protein